MKKQSFSPLEPAHKKKRTKRKVFPDEMDAAVHRAPLEALISPHYTKSRKRRPQMPHSVMLRIFFAVAVWPVRSWGRRGADDMHSIRNFAGLDLGHDAISDDTTILIFRHLLEQHTLTEALFSAVKSHLRARALLLRGGTIIHCPAVECLHPIRGDATLTVALLPTTKNYASATLK